MLRRLNRTGRHESVVQAFEAGAVQNTEATFGEYVKALVKLDSLDSSRMYSTLQRGAEASFAARGLAAAPPAAYPPPAAAAPWFAGEARISKMSEIEHASFLWCVRLRFARCAELHLSRRASAL
jgi:hypothetical protein